MSREPVRTGGGSWLLQGCLFGAVALFVVLLLVMLFLGYQRFRENTQPSPETMPAGPTVSIDGAPPAWPLGFTGHG